jgi:hypothetical protein
MSFDIFLQCFRDKAPATFERSNFEDVFGAYIVSRESNPGFVGVKFPDGSHADVYISELENIDGLMVNHCGGDAFFQALYQLADRTKSSIYWPGSAPSSVVTDDATVLHLPEGFAENFGTTVVKDGAGIIGAIQRV